MTRRRRFALIAGLLASSLAGCSRPTPAAAAAPRAVAHLPPGARVYLQVEVKSLLAAPAIGPVRELFAEWLSEECLQVLDETTRATWADYGSPLDRLGRPAERERPPPRIVALVEGPPRETVNPCIDAAVGAAGSDARTESIGGRDVVRLGDEIAVFSVDDRTHVICNTSMLDAALAATAGGPTLGHSPLVAALAAVPAGDVVAAVDAGPDAFAAWFGGLGGEGGAPPAVSSRIAISVDAGDDFAVSGAALLADERVAALLEAAASRSLSIVRAIGPLGMSRSTREWAKPTLDSIRVTREGSVVKASVRIPASLPARLFGGEDFW